ncbi:MAG: DUF885 domain-containing protein [Verrucomicrobiae bacterium]|nr:DUF885 domain-containing protein [Verrucomicrobiae bacterium]
MFIPFYKFSLTGIVVLIVCTTTVGHADPVTATNQLHALFDEDWEQRLAEDPVSASYIGDRRWNDQWPDVSTGTLERENDRRREMLARLKRIDRGVLSSVDQTNYDLFAQAKQRAIDEHNFRWYLIVLNQRGGIQTADELADAIPFESVKDYEDWIQRLRGMPKYIEQTQALMRDGIRFGMLLPQVIMQRVPSQIDKQIVDKPEDSPFFKPFKEFPDTVTQSDRDRLIADSCAALRDQVVPAYREFHRFFTEEYLPACPDASGAWNLPNGKAMYAFFARSFTTTSMTPDEIHETGLAEVARIREQMEAVKTQVGFTGTLQEFFEHLRTDPKFYYQSPAELLAGYESVSRKINPLMDKMFRTLPRIPYKVEAIPANIAPDTTAAYYRPPAGDGSRPGGYFVNLYKPEMRPKYEMVALSLHEAVPGHHLQIALAMELGELPKFRRHARFTAFVEGWGLYSEYLGEELGLYSDPYDKFGQLTYEIWRAIRLVVDTGIHHKHWTRQQAIDYFRENAAKSELDIVNEIDRYIAWPGQALAYKIGELKIKELRQRAQKALREEFDLRAFHEVVLNQGAIPLDVLERSVDAWIVEGSQ